MMSTGTARSAITSHMMLHLTTVSLSDRVSSPHYSQQLRTTCIAEPLISASVEKIGYSIPISAFNKIGFCFVFSRCKLQTKFIITGSSADVVVGRLSLAHLDSGS